VGSVLPVAAERVAIPEKEEEAPLARRLLEADMAVLVPEKELPRNQAARERHDGEIEVDRSIVAEFGCARGCSSEARCQRPGL